MRKLLILTIALLINVATFAQRAVHTQAIPVSSINESGLLYPHGNSLSRTTAIGDTDVLSNIPAADTPLYVYSAGVDSGYLTGTNAFNDLGFAECYNIDISADDSSIILIGVVAQFHGVVNPASLNTVTFNAWDIGFPQVVSATYNYGGFPQDVMDSVIVPVTQIGIGASMDTIKAYLFPVATGILQSSFFIGYTANYNFYALNGDTIGLACSKNGDRVSITYTTADSTDSIVNEEGTADSAIFVTDTTINVQNATMWADFAWHDNYTNNDSLLNDLAIYPIAVVNGPSGIKGITRKGLTFFGNYPNPAINSTNIKFSLLKNADVTIQIMDMSGHVLNTLDEPNLSAGEHIIPVNTSAMPGGDYLYLIHTSGGDGIASKMTVLR